MSATAPEAPDTGLLEVVTDATVPVGASGAPFRPTPAGFAARVGVLVALLALVLAVPQLVPGVYVNVVTKAAVYGLVALSLNVLLGYAGLVSLGHSAFFGVGAFGAGYALTKMQLPWGAAVLMAALTGAVAAVVLGAIALRLRAVYFTLVTISYGFVAQETLFNIHSLTGGGAGQPAPRPSLFHSDVRYAYLCIGILAVAMVFDWRFTASRGGRAVQALRDDERVAASWGIDVTGYKIMAFVISGIMAGIAGALFASIEQVVTPADFGFALSLTFLLATVVGGAGNRWGVVQGGILFAVLPTIIDRAHANFHVWPFTAISITLEPAVEALLLILTLIFFPGGIAQQQRNLLSWLSFKRFRQPEAGGGPARGGMGARP
ncbi:MAG: branched-chain amino acid ABC transporter permease [Actinobacteria bacterium]|nr:branched-chain amino acid ABC transporter permease [Actinomycetota bacterium]MBV9936222.1 branched-chain amino acid ABC transporter permease [Actinomycetota bacterium]